MFLHTKRTTSWGNRLICRVQRANGRPCSGSGWGVESGRRLVVWPEPPSAHIPPVCAWSNRRGLTESTAAITANRRATRPSYAAIASTPLVDSPRCLLNAQEGASAPSRGSSQSPVAPRLPTVCSIEICYTRASVRPSECTPEGQVAQLVEHRTENAGVAGSIPALATNPRLPPNPSEYG